MQLSNLLGLRVLDAGHHPVGTVIDVRLKLAEGGDGNPESPRLIGLVISPRTRSSYLGYERTDIDAPWLIATIAGWRHRGTFLAEWGDVARVGADHVTLRAGYTRRPATLRSQ
ncbi:hypothetical protein A5731_30630 [Mycolicibacterium conceptionense]|jgi:sporulation protein YlmC with PRC-barrel domain|uniref:PRC-barrel domain-containing protein n=3 Tax=Mycolicibacterium TaxID=1866885 RepID=A0A0J8WZ27_9MYCO|nr:MULTISPECIES: hypothetical protein [Mycolicibacterium]KLI07607.1 hypothetical protein AA982_12925 [Mycolicibacterium senegalense]KLO51568.1 hypothetical protein ABW05_08575 [Mycolicibacterium senegalense]KMV18434.1 hypothetical protein ACT17_10515 [Mycolicibacterium conceptionense]MCW1819350.1 hypothetical protein [Mycolicibacterium senegalense]OBB08635.1 hypothetical protein A5718_14380 [Mycolicibacterium conceptionense]